eukprot:scaffold131945_cov24-Phaeocystis_antarctica.AAC.1
MPPRAVSSLGLCRKSCRCRGVAPPGPPPAPPAPSRLGLVGTGAPPAPPVPPLAAMRGVMAGRGTPLISPRASTEPGDCMPPGVPG